MDDRLVRRAAARAVGALPVRVATQLPPAARVERRRVVRIRYREHDRAVAAFGVADISGRGDEARDLRVGHLGAADQERRHYGRGQWPFLGVAAQAAELQTSTGAALNAGGRAAVRRDGAGLEEGKDVGDR